MQNPAVQLWCEDEVHFQRHSSLMRMWAPKGRQPRVISPSVRHKVGYFGALNLKTGQLMTQEAPTFSAQTFGDFELLIDYKTVPKADSGIYLRGVPQVQIWDYTEEAKFNLGANKGSGGLWNNSAGAPGKDPLVRADKPLEEWNRLRIVMVGARVSVWLNGAQVVDHAIMENYYDRATPVPARGPIQLQTHGGEIRWRNIFIREIGR